MEVIMLNLNESFNCDCGKTHSIDTEILYSKGCLDNIVLLLKKYYGISRIAIVYDTAVTEIAQKTLEILVKNGFDISEICYKKLVNPTKADSERLLNLDENVRFFVGIGGGSIATIVRYASFIRGNDYGLIATCPSTDSYLDKQSILENKVVFCKYPKFLIADANIYATSPEYLIASGIGVVYNAYLSLFLLEYKKAIYRKNYCLTVANDVKRLLDNFTNNYEKTNNQSEYLMNTLLKLSLARSYLGNFDSSAGELCYLLSKSDTTRFYGENLFLATYVLVDLYISFLEGYSIDTLIPADYVKGLKLLNLKLGENYSYSKDKFVEYKEENITAIGYLIKEYKADFLKTLKAIDSEKYAKIFRRCYFDAGFWLGGYIKATDLLSVTSLAGLISDNSLYSFMKKTGFLEEML